MIALFYMRRNFGGGATSFTVHLFEALRLIGAEPKIFRVNVRSESRERPLAQYSGVAYRNVSPEEATDIVKKNPSVMTGAVHSRDVPFAPDIIPHLVRHGMRVTIYDPNEFKVYDHLDASKIKRPFCIRPTMRKFFKDAVLVPAPYVREFGETNYSETVRPLLAVSVARVSFVKRTEIILEANELLPEKRRVVLRGAENRLYTRFKIIPRFRKFRQGQSGYPMTWGASSRECAKAYFAVDLTYFPDDGGGSQYSLLEAWDAGTVNVLHRDWLRYKGEMQDLVNCLAVDDAKSLASLLRDGDNIDRAPLVNAGYAALKPHDPATVAQKYMRELTR